MKKVNIFEFFQQLALEIENFLSEEIKKEIDSLL